MTGLDEFVEIFGAITVSDIVTLVFAGVFLYALFIRVRKYLVNRYETEALRDKKVAEVLDAVSQYPEYRKQSLQIQQQLESQIQELRKAQELNNARLETMENDLKRRERNKLRARLLQSYRFYTNPERNPSQSWTRMEAEAFWELFRDYEDANGNGYIHTEVQPAMERLTVIELD